MQTTRQFAPLQVIILSFTLIMPFFVSAEDTIMRKAEMQIYGYFLKLNLRHSDQQNLVYIDSISTGMDSLVKSAAAQQYSFDTLHKVMGILDAPDGAFRVYNWAFPRTDGTYLYFAYIVSQDKNEHVQVFKLNDVSDSITDPKKAAFNNTNWYGCLYYEVLHNRVNKKDIYTLLGWDGQDLFTNQKIVEILTFANNGEPQFGKNLFNGPFSKFKRVMLQYSEKSSMTLNYNKQKNMIIFDHLSPVKSQYTGHYEYYGADFSYDALMFVDGKWKYQPDIDIRLDKPAKKKRKP